MSDSGIVVIPSWYPSEKDPVAGIFIQQQAKALRSAGVNINVFFVEESLDPRYFGNNAVKYEEEDGLPVFRMKVFVPPKRIKKLRFCWFRHWSALMNAYYHQNDHLPALLHAHSFLGGAAAKDLFEKFGVPYFLTEHHGGIATGDVPTYWERELKEIYGSAKKVMAVSSLLQKAVKIYYDNVVLLPNMIDTDLFFPATAKKQEKKFRIVNVGGLDPEKNVSYLVQAITQLEKPDTIELILVGEGLLIKNIKRQVRRLGLDSQISFKGRQSPRELANLMRQANLYVSTSMIESFGMAMAEAMACGLPVITFDVGIATEIIDGKNGTVIKDPRGIAPAIEFFRRNPDDFDPYKSFELIRKNFGKNRIIDQLKKEYGKQIDPY